MGMEYEIEYYGVVELTQDMVLMDLGLNTLSNEKIMIELKKERIYLCLHVVCDETLLCLAKMIRLVLTYCDKAVIKEI
ncbi:MAG: hypothetical protein FD167_380 [bacterium]|nr:MAG: hypothetical protein FD167_380 [bacterium]